jgi:hypothetical protein
MRGGNQQPDGRILLRIKYFYFYFETNCAFFPVMKQHRCEREDSPLDLFAEGDPHRVGN